jgi:HSP20 family molecular chaperone IbpA
VIGLERDTHDAPLPDSPLGDVPGRWEGGGHVYFEFELPGLLGSEVDICIHGGRVFIRIKR